MSEMPWWHSRNQWDDIDPTAVIDAAWVRHHVEHHVHGETPATVLDLAPGPHGVWYVAVSHPRAEGPPRPDLWVLAVRPHRVADGTTDRGVSVFYASSQRFPAACPARLLALVPAPRQRHDIIAWWLACLVADADSVTPRDGRWCGPLARTLRALHPAPLAPALAHRWAQQDDALLRTALVRRPDLPSDVLATVAAQWTDVTLRTAMAAHPAMTPALVPQILGVDPAGPHSDVCAALLAHPHRATLLADQWDLLLQRAMRGGYWKVITDLLLCPECPVRVLTNARTLVMQWYEDLGRDDALFDDIARTARVRLFRRALTDEEWVPVVVAASRAIRVSDLPRLARRTPALLHAIVRATLRASTNPEIVAAMTAAA